MKTIWKYELETVDVQEIEIPEGIEFLEVQTQNEKPCIWGIVDPEALWNKVRFRIRGTGHPIKIDESKKEHYLGSYQLMDGAFVGHVFIEE